MVFDNLLDKEKVYWLNYLLRMEQLFANKVQQLQESNFAPMHPQRKALLKQANGFYQEFYALIRKDLCPFVSKEALLSEEVLNYNYNNLSTFSLGYLLRDWGTGQENEQQQLITQTIEQKLQALGLFQEGGQALFMGCGMGRYAVDLAPHYEQVTAFDASVLMIWCIEYLQKMGSWKVLNKAERNCRTIASTIQEEEVSMTPAQIATIQSKVNFLVANATAIPLEKASVEHIYSIYFTDVLPLPELYQQVDKLLKEKGLFVHFGPLEYFFNQEEQMLSAEEVSLFFEGQGYQILVDEFMPSKHLSSENSMRHRVYDNWFFVAQKPIATTASLTLNSVLLLNNQVELSTRAIIQEGVCEQVAYQVQWAEHAYNLPAVVYELLLEINGQASLQDLFQALELQDIDSEDQAQLFQILQELLNHNLLQITTHS